MEAAVLFFKSKLGIGLLAAIAIAAILLAVFTLGSSYGYSKGFKAGSDGKQKTIDAMLDQQDADNKALNTKINKLERGADADADVIEGSKKEAVTKRANIVKAFRAKVEPVTKTDSTTGLPTPESSGSGAPDNQCGWAPATVQAINAMLATQVDVSQLKLSLDITGASK